MPRWRGSGTQDAQMESESDAIIRLPKFKVHYGTPDVVQMAEAFAQTLGISEEALTEELVASREALQGELDTLLPPSIIPSSSPPPSFLPSFLSSFLLFFLHSSLLSIHSSFRSSFIQSFLRSFRSLKFLVPFLRSSFRSPVFSYFLPSCIDQAGSGSRSQGSGSSGVHETMPPPIDIVFHPDQRRLRCEVACGFKQPCAENTIH